jgi:hypothetical protein
MKTVNVSPIDLQIGDRVFTHGAVLEVAYISNHDSDVPGGVRTAACISRLVGDENGSIPRGWFESRETMRARGCEWAMSLPEGRYWNVQGNAHASVLKIVEQ